jgi:peptide/nickel transport system permease protein
LRFSRRIDMDIPEQATVTQDELEPLLELTPALVQKRRSQGRIIFDRFIRNRAAVVGAIFLVIMILGCFLGPLVWRLDPNYIDPASPINGAPSLVHPFGTEGNGRDELARIMVGGQVSLLVAIISMLCAIVFGVTIGAFAGYYGGVVDNILMRLTDMVLAIPLYLILFVLSAAFTNGSPGSVIILIAILGWTVAARLVRSEFLALREREFVMAARTVGARDLRLMFLHILPNAAGAIIVNATLLVGTNIILESVMSFFGFGIQPPNASWGNMVADGQHTFDQAPWLVFFPALLIFLTVLSFNLVGDGLRDALDPHMTER